MYTIAYLYKNKNGYIKEKTEVFTNIHDAMNKIRQLTNSGKAVGTPSIEQD